MTANRHDGPSLRYRVWLARYCGGRSKDDDGTPATATALEPAEQGTFSARGADRYVRAFNRAIVARPGCNVRALAVPVAVRFDGDAQPGQDLPPPSAQKKPAVRLLGLDAQRVHAAGYA